MTTARVEQLVPHAGDPYVMRTVDGVDETDTIARVIRQTDQPSRWTVHDSARNLIWISYDEQRRAFVRALGQADGEPVPCE